MGTDATAKKIQPDQETTWWDLDLVGRMEELIDTLETTIETKADGAPHDSEFTLPDSKKPVDSFEKIEDSPFYAEVERLIADPLARIREFFTQSIEASFDIDPYSPGVRGDMVYELAKEKLQKFMGEGHDPEVKITAKDICDKVQAALLKEKKQSLEDFDFTKPENRKELADRITKAMKETVDALPPRLKVDIETRTWKLLEKVSEKDVARIYEAVETMKVISGDKVMDRFLHEIGVDKEEWDRAKTNKGALISEKLREPDCKTHQGLADALRVAESWFETNKPYGNPEHFRMSLIKAYAAGLKADRPSEVSSLVNDAMKSHLEILDDAEIKRAREIIEHVETAAVKEREAREEKEKKGI